MKVVQCLVDPLIERNPGLDLVCEFVLHLAEQVVCTLEDRGRPSELPKDLVPLLHTGSMFGDLDTS